MVVGWWQLSESEVDSLLPGAFLGQRCSRSPALPYCRAMRSGVIAQLGLLTLADAIRRVSSASRGCSFQARRILHRATDARSTDAATVALDPLAASVALFMRDRKSTRLNSSHYCTPRMPSSA